MKIRVVLVIYFFLTLFFSGCSKKELSDQSVVSTIKVYYIDSKNGNDANHGKSPSMAWKTLNILDTLKLNPGDTVRFKRGSVFEGLLTIKRTGVASKYITFSDYGIATDPAPSFTNKTFQQDNFGNCIRVKGSYVIIENLYFSHTASYVDGNYTTDGGWTEWQMGAVFIDKSAKNCVVRNNEFFDCVAGIKSYGQNAIIEYNYIHDCNRALREWTWGPIGIWLGADYQEVRYNKIFNMRVEDARIPWNGADGGAFEIDDQRNDKTHIAVHHNYTRDCQGFMEITGKDVLTSVPNYSGLSIHHNISDDYQQFMLMWGGTNCRIENNTVIRRKVNSNERGCILISQSDSKNNIANNIFVVENDVQVFLAGQNDNITTNSAIQNNLYYNASTSSTPRLGKEGAGSSPVYGDPQFINYSSATITGDFAIRQGSPAINKGINLNYPVDFIGTAIPQSGVADIGAFEFK